MRKRERDREKLSESIRRDTERKWEQDRFLSSAGDNGAWIDCDENRDD